MNMITVTSTKNLPCKYVKQYLIGDLIEYKFEDITVTVLYSVSDFLNYIHYLAYPPKPATFRWVWLDLRTGEIEEM